MTAEKKRDHKTLKAIARVLSSRWLSFWTFLIVGTLIHQILKNYWFSLIPMGVWVIVAISDGLLLWWLVRHDDDIKEIWENQKLIKSFENYGDALTRRRN